LASTIIFRSAQIVTPQKILKGDLVIKNNKIKEIKPHHPKFIKEFSQEENRFRQSHLMTDSTFMQEIDCKNLTIIPGLIDTHVHFRDPGSIEKEDFDTGTQAAASGGVTTIFDMPNTNPSTITAENLEKKKQMAQAKANVNYNFFVGLTNDNFAEINQLSNIAGIKIFFGSSTGNLLVNDLHYLDRVFHETRHTLAFHAEDENIIQYNLKKYQNQNDSKIHSRIHSREAEISAIETLLKLAQKHPKTHVHFCHVTTKEAVELFEKYALKNVTAEVTMHHLLLNEDHYEKLHNFLKINPAIRTKTDNKALLQALKKGTIQSIATDHAPHLQKEKEQNYVKAPSGVPMVELTLPLLLNLAHQGKINLAEIVKWTAQKPAEIYQIAKKGKLKAGFDADFTIVDLKTKHTIKNNQLFTKCKWTPFNQKEITGKIVATYVNGELVFQNHKIVQKNLGKEVFFSS